MELMPDIYDEAQRYRGCDKLEEENADLKLIIKVLEEANKVLAKHEVENKRLKDAIKEIEANHGAPHRQRMGCRRTTVICREALGG